MPTFGNMGFDYFSAFLPDYAELIRQAMLLAAGESQPPAPTPPTLPEIAQLTPAEQASTRIPQRSDTEIQETARLARMKEQRRGRGSTILTGSAGVTSPFQAGRPQLAGVLG
mgnify:CR=1 FL=1